MSPLLSLLRPLLFECGVGGGRRWSGGEGTQQAHEMRGDVPERKAAAIVAPPYHVLSPSRGLHAGRQHGLHTLTSRSLSLQQPTMRRTQSVRNHPNNKSTIITSDDLGILRETGDESMEDVLRRQLVEKDRENDRVGFTTADATDYGTG